MKKSLCLAASLLAFNLTPGFGQPAATPPPPVSSPLPAPGRVPRYAPAASTFSERLNAIQARAGADQADASALTKFNLDFPGGTPKELVAAIEKAMGRPLNVIVSPDEKSAKAKLPPVKVSDMDVARLFNTLRENTQIYDDNHRDLLRSEGFFTRDGNPTDNSLWTFSVYEKPSVLTRFNLDFPGGTPAQLVKAVEKAIGKPLNAIIPTESADVQLPPLKMNDVDVERLFHALEIASYKQVQVSSGSYYGLVGRALSPSYQNYNTSCGFKTDGAVSDNSVWYFHAEKPAEPSVVPVEKTCQFYSLADYLEAGLTVDDITTVIQNGWKMTGVNPTPELKYHKETKLLMAYGEPEQLSTINDVLKVLKPKAPLALSEDQIRQRLLEKRQSEMNVSTNTPAEKAVK